jgi:DNA uptake protein ComE-like DNA-binding protein
MWKRFVNDYLSYTHKERIGIFVLLGLITICLLIPLLYPYSIHQKQYDHKEFNNEIARLKLLQSDSIANKKYAAKNFNEDYLDYAGPSDKNNFTKVRAEIFYFDPNKASIEEWKRLGIKDKTIATIQKYLSKGGHFYKPEDISKIWGLSPADIRRLMPYIRIENKGAEYVKNPVEPFTKKPSYTPKSLASVDINLADTTAFIALPGIGSKLAQRIINFRSKLGGFYNVSQVGETFGLPDSTFQKIKSRLVITSSSVKNININTALLDDMKVHPYIRYNIANAIIQYRVQHGNFSSVADIKKIVLVTDEVYKKVEPYLTVTE